MAAIKMEDLVSLEAEHGLSDDGLSYQHRCSRITAVLKGEDWTPPVVVSEPKRGNIITPRAPGLTDGVRNHPLFGKKLLIAPLLANDKNRMISYEENVGHEIDVNEVNAGEMLYDMPKDTQRMVGDYEVVRENKNKPVMAKSHVPKTGVELSYTVGKGLPGIPVARGVKGATGYLWSFKSCLIPVGDTMVQFHGLKTLIAQIAPELLPKFSGSPMMQYVDGFTLVASIPMTEALLKAYKREALKDERLGLL